MIEDFKHDVLQDEKLVLLDFFAEWCAPCKNFAQVLHEVAEDEKLIKHFRFCKVDIDNEKAFTATQNIHSVPTVVILKQNKEIAKKIGSMNKTQLLTWLTDIASKHSLFN